MQNLKLRTPNSELRTLNRRSTFHALSEAEAELAARGIPNPRLDAEVLLAQSLGIDRTRLYARLHDLLSQQQRETFQRLVQRRARREPLQYITGIQEFWSFEFKVDRRVLVPRPETELLVEIALHLLGEKESAHFTLPAPCFLLPAPRLLDIGTGSGCIAITLAKELLEAEIWATDTSRDALAVAAENAHRHGVAERIKLLQGDLFAPLAGHANSFDLIISNPPYIAQNDLGTLQAEVRDWEPHDALDGGTDGLDFHRRLLHEGPAYLRPGGWLVMEIGHRQSSAILHFARERQGLTDYFCAFDYAGCERVVAARKA